MLHLAYTEAINLMNYSSVVIPVTKADKKIDVFDDSYHPNNEVDRMNWEACRSTFQSSCSVSISHGTKS
jgi:amidase